MTTRFQEKPVFVPPDAWLSTSLQAARRVVAITFLSVGVAGAQTLPLPDRKSDAPLGSSFATKISALPLPERESEILGEILSGNVPGFLRQLCPVTITNVMEDRTNYATFYVTADYVAVGADEDYLLAPLTPSTAQRLADRLDCTMPTPTMVDAIYATAEGKLAPAPIPPSAAMTSVPVFLDHNDIIRTQRVAVRPLSGALVAGHKKDVVISAKLAAHTNKVAIYGWHRTNGEPIQPLYLGHTATWVDYSHGIRLVAQAMRVNGHATTVSRVLADPQLAGLLSDEGVITNPRYSTNEISPGAKVDPSGKFTPTNSFGEHVATLTFEPDVRIQINAPTPDPGAPAKPVLLVLYALPNGNSIEQTVGRTLQPGDDWHFNIQHIGAQTRFLRALLTNRTVVVAYLEAQMKSWPAWRRKYGDNDIPGIIERVKSFFSTNQIEVVLTGHSGGGSFTFGYINTQPEIPSDVVHVAFLDSNYAYETTNHFAKLAHWLRASRDNTLCVLAYHDSIALLDGKTFVSERGGTWGRSHAMLADLGTQFQFSTRTNAGLQTHSALNGRLQFLLQENPDKKILHTVQVERNGFIHALLLGTTLEGKGYDYFGERAYNQWIQGE